MQRNYKYNWPGKTDLICTKYNYSYYGKYLLFHMSYSKSVSFIEFRMDFCIYDDILDTIRIQKESYYNLSSQNQVTFNMQIRPVFPGPVTNRNPSFIWLTLVYQCKIYDKSIDYGQFRISLLLFVLFVAEINPCNYFFIF